MSDDGCYAKALPTTSSTPTPLPERMAEKNLLLASRNRKTNSREQFLRTIVSSSTTIRVCFHWTMYDATGAVFVTGTSFATFGNDGRLVQATGFFKTPAPTA